MDFAGKHMLSSGELIGRCHCLLAAARIHRRSVPSVNRPADAESHVVTRCFGEHQVGPCLVIVVRRMMILSHCRRLGLIHGGHLGQATIAIGSFGMLTRRWNYEPFQP